MIDDCLKLTAYFGERQRAGRGFYADALLDVFGRHGVATSIMLRGVAGFGVRHRLRSDVSLSMSEDPSAMAIAVDNATKIQAALDDVLAIKQQGALTLERARLLRDDARGITLPESAGEATKLTIYVGRQERVSGVPTYVAVCDLLHRRGLDGASVIVGVDGTAHGRRERARFFDHNAAVPTMVIAIGSGEVLSVVLPELAALLRRPLASVERVRVCKRDGVLLERPPELPASDARGRGVWQKLMVYTSESQLHEGEPIHRALVRRLRASEARGATVLRGVWGFHGDHRPHGDKFFQLGRHVPAATIIVDTPAGIARSFDVVDELTTEHGLVTAEIVPAMLTMSGPVTSGGLDLVDLDL